MAILLTILSFAVIVLLANVGGLLKDHAATRQKVEAHDAALRAVQTNLLNLLENAKDSRQKMAQLHELIQNLFDTIDK